MASLEPSTVKHPWCDQWIQRYEYLSSLITQHEKCETPDVTENTVQPAPKSEIDDVVIADLFECFIRDPQHSIKSQCHCLIDQHIDLNKWHACMSNEWSKYSEVELQSTLLRLFDELPALLSNSTIPLSVGPIMTVLLEAYASRTNRSLSHLLADRIVGLSKLPSGFLLVAEFILPTLLLLPNSRQSAFVLSLLRDVAAPQHTILLKYLCQTTKIWPTESYNVFQFLLNQLTRTVHDSNLLTPVDCTSSVLQGFQQQYILCVDLYRSVPFANLLMLFIKYLGKNKMDDDLWISLNEIVQKQDNFLRNPLLQLLSSVRSTTTSSSPRSPIL